MRLLALDTCLGACSAAVVDGDRPLAARSETMERGHQERLGPLLREVLAEAGVRWNSLDRIVVTVGPGSFTGLRVGVSFAKGLELALGRPVVGVGALPALAASANGDGSVIAAVDAKRGQVWMQAFRDGAQVAAAEAPDWADAPACAAALAASEPATLIGSAAAWAASGLAGARVIPAAAPDILAVARLGALVDPADAQASPIYLRAPDAKPQAA